MPLLYQHGVCWFCLVSQSHYHQLLLQFLRRTAMTREWVKFSRDLIGPFDQLVSIWVEFHHHCLGLGPGLHCGLGTSPYWYQHPDWSCYIYQSKRSKRKIAYNLSLTDLLQPVASTAPLVEITILQSLPQNTCFGRTPLGSETGCGEQWLSLDPIPSWPERGRERGMVDRMCVRAYHSLLCPRNGQSFLLKMWKELDQTHTLSHTHTHTHTLTRTLTQLQSLTTITHSAHWLLTHLLNDSIQGAQSQSTE